MPGSCFPCVDATPAGRFRKGLAAEVIRTRDHYYNVIAVQQDVRIRGFLPASPLRSTAQAIDDYNSPHR
jgi:hypothetical protein